MSKAVLKIEFAGAGADSGLHMAAIADFERNMETVDGKRQEKTTFYPGDQFYFLLQHDAKLRLSHVASSWGAVQALGPVSRQHEDSIELRGPGDDKSLSYTPAGSVAVRWYGNAPSLDTIGRQISYRSGPLPAIGTLSYQSRWQSYRLIPGALSLGPDEEWPVLIVAYLEPLP